jgi:hypothetical protein
MTKKPTKKQRLNFYTKRQSEDDFKTGYKQSAKWKIKQAKQMIDYESEAKRRGVPVSRVIAESIR